MLTYRTLSRIASAQSDAERMRLPQTAGRLEVLRRELDGFMDLPPGRQEAKKRWALAKLDDTEKTLCKEKEQISGNDLEHFGQMRAIAKIVKTAVYLCITVCVADMLKRAAGGTMADIGLILSGGLAAALGAGAFIKRLVGGDFDVAAKNIEKAIEECKKVLSRG